MAEEAQTLLRDDASWPKPSVAYFALAVIIFATFLNFFDQTTFGLLIDLIKKDFGLSNTAMGLLGGPVNVIFFLVVMFPLSRFADIYPRKYVLAVGALLIALLNATGGFTMSFMTLAFTRMFVGAGGGAHAPASYSMLSDFFPPEKRKWPFAILQLGFIGGTTIGAMIAGKMLGVALKMPETHFAGIALHSWKYVLIMLAMPGVIAFILFLFVPEPQRRGVIADGKPLPLTAVFSELSRKRAVYAPLFIALGLSTICALANSYWVVPLFSRSYGWSPLDFAARGPLIMLIGSLLGLVAGPLLIKWLSARYRDVNVRAVTICFAIAAPFAILAPLMPNPWLALGCFAITGMMGVASATPQNLTIQEITPNQMRGQMTGLYLMMFIAVGALGPFLGGVLTDHLFGHDTDLWKSIALLASLFLIATYIMSRAIKPYKAELDRLDTLAHSPNMH